MSYFIVLRLSDKAPSVLVGTREVEVDGRVQGLGRLKLTAEFSLSRSDVDLPAQG
jgi:hypothetical protein